MNGTSLSELLSSIAEKGGRILGTLSEETESRRVARLTELCEELLSGRGKASGAVVGREALDRSSKAESAGLMVNYLYDLDRIASNHEKYVNGHEVIASNGVKRLPRAPSRQRRPAADLAAENGRRQA